MRKFKFWKMHSLGNDFIVIYEGFSELNVCEFSSDYLKTISDRKTGIGADQILLIANSDISKGEFTYKVINADGNEVEQCGNGARCVKRFIYDNNLWLGDEIALITANERMWVRSKNNKDFVVRMNIQGTEAGDVKLNHGLVEKRKVEKQFSYELRVGDERLINLFFVSMGNPHGVCWDNYLDKKTMKEIYGFFLEHKIFENGINIEFCKIISDQSISMTVFERGVGETLACGSGACAAVVSGILIGNLKSGSPIEVRLEKGSLFVEWSGKIRDPVFLSGPAKKVFEGEIYA